MLLTLFQMEGMMRNYKEERLRVDGMEGLSAPAFLAGVGSPQIYNDKM